MSPLYHPDYPYITLLSLYHVYINPVSPQPYPHNTPTSPHLLRLHHPYKERKLKCKCGVGWRWLDGGGFWHGCKAEYYLLSCSTHSDLRWRNEGFKSSKGLGQSAHGRNLSPRYLYTNEELLGRICLLSFYDAG